MTVPWLVQRLEYWQSWVTAAATIGAGLTSDTDSIVDDYSIGTGIAAGTVIDLPLCLQV